MILPDWVQEVRPWQKIAVAQILEAFEHYDVVVLDAPTGSGKTLIAEMVRQRLQARAVYCCTSIHLQEQFCRDFPDAKLLKGRSNYLPEGIEDGNDDWAGATCADCSKPGCNLCISESTCPYELAKSEALRSRLAVVNTAYFLTESNGPGRFSGRDLVVVDEADTLEKGLMDYAGVEIGKGTCLRFGIREPERVTVTASWRKWMDDTIPRLTAKRGKIQGDDLRAARQRNQITRLLGRLRWIAPQIETNWVYTGKNGRVSFKPVTVADLAPQLLWKHGRKWLLMSATVISAGNLLDELGWTGGFGSVSVPSTFPVENRPVKIVPAADMARRANDAGSLIGPLEQIVRRHADERVLLHCVSYDLARYLYGELSGCCEEIGMGISTYHASDGKARAVIEYSEGDGQGHLLIAPSLDRGVDFADDRCRVIVVAKIPYPYLGDRQVSARIHSPGGQVWYNVQTIRTLVQMTGRGVRHDTDHCVTYVLDRQFENLWGRSRNFFPAWWKDALIWERNGFP